MPIPTTDVIGLLSDNLRLRPDLELLTRRASQGWAHDLDLPMGGHQVFYTGQMHQLIPYLEALSVAREWVQDSPLSRFSRVGLTVNRFVHVTRLLGTPPQAHRHRYEKVLIDVVTLLRHIGLDPGYLYDDDLYTGALLPEDDGDELLRQVGTKIRDRLLAHGVEEVITADPRTTIMFRTVFPRLVPDFTVGVRHYVEVLAEESPMPLHDLGQTVVLHDSCLFTRSERLLDAPRALLRAGGLAVVPETHADDQSTCCSTHDGMDPAASRSAAEARVAALRAVASSGVTLCPLCLVNLRRAAHGTMPFQDISTFLRRAYTP